MTHLLHIDSSVQGDRSVSRALTARAAQRWRAAHPGGTVTYRDLAAEPLPHLNPQNSADLSARLVDEVKAAEGDVILTNLSPDAFTAEVAQKEPGQTLKLDVWRQGEKKSFSLKLAEMPAELPTGR